MKLYKFKIILKIIFKNIKEKSDKECTDKINQLDKEKKNNNLHRN